MRPERNGLVAHLMFALSLLIGATLFVTGCSKSGTNDQRTANTKKDGKDADAGKATKRTDEKKPDDKKSEREEIVYKGKSADHWLKQLADRDEDTKLEAIKALTAIQTKMKTGDDRIPIALLDSLEPGDVYSESPIYKETMSAFRLFDIRFDTKQTSPAFGRVLQRDIKNGTDNYIRQVVVCRMIGQTNNEGYAPLLVTLIKRKDCDDSLASYAVKALSLCVKKGSTITPTLIELWRDCPHKGAKEKLAELINYIDPAAAKKAGI